MRLHARRLGIALAVTTLITACSTWSTSNVDRAAGTLPLPQTRPSSIILTDRDITDRPYSVLGDIEVTINKTTIFHPDPTREMADEKLREEAAKLGAEAVILVRYGDAGVTAASWGTLNAKGRAIVFDK